MKIVMQLFCGLLLLLSGCRFTEDKNTAVKKDKVKKLRIHLVYP